MATNGALPHRHACDDAEDCTYCGRIEARRVRLQQQRVGRALPFYVVGFIVHRRYGGPEEGGWYYDEPETIDVRKCYDWTDGLRAARELRQEFTPSRAGRCSVANEPDGYVRVCRFPEDFPGHGFTRPDYE